MKEISFLTLHPEGTNVDLTKDEGQIPYTLSKMGIDATIVTSYIDKTTANLKNVPGLNVKHFPLIFNSSITGLVYILLHILLEAFAKSASYHNWDLLLVGSVEDDFRPYIDKFFKNHPMLERRVKFVGVITDRNVLYEKYCTSKVFVLPSRWESYGISAVEALNCGCYLLLSDSIPPANEMTNNGKYGCVVEAENIDDLTRNIIDMTKREYDQNEINEMVKYAGEEFSWERICKKLLVEMRRVSKKGDI